MNNCERCGRPRKLSAFGLCDDCQIELAGEPNPVDPGDLARFRAALAAPEPSASATIRARVTMTGEGAPTASRDICEDEIARADVAEERAVAAERKLAAATEAHRALVGAARAVIKGFRRVGESGYSEVRNVLRDALRDALAALEGEDDVQSH